MPNEHKTFFQYDKLTPELVRELTPHFLQELSMLERFLSQIYPQSGDPKLTRSLENFASNPVFLWSLIGIFNASPTHQLPKNNGVLASAVVHQVWELKIPELDPKLEQPFASFSEEMGKLAFYFTQLRATQSHHSIPLPPQLGTSRKLLGLDLGVLKLLDGHLVFSDPLLEEYFCAHHLKGVQLSDDMIGTGYFQQALQLNEWGKPLIALCGITENPDALIGQIQEKNELLTMMCIESGANISPAAANRAINLVLQDVIHPERHHLSDSNIRHFAADTLRRGGPLAIRKLAEATLLVKWPANASIIGELAKTNSVEAVPALLYALKVQTFDYEIYVKFALLALTRIGGNDAVTGLLGFLKDGFEQYPEEYFLIAVEGLVKMEQSATTILNHLANRPKTLVDSARSTILIEGNSVQKSAATRWKRST